MIRDELMRILPWMFSLECTGSQTAMFTGLILGTGSQQPHIPMMLGTKVAEGNGCLKNLWKSKATTAARLEWGKLGMSFLPFISSSPLPLPPYLFLSSLLPTLSPVLGTEPRTLCMVRQLPCLVYMALLPLPGPFTIGC